MMKNALSSREKTEYRAGSASVIVMAMDFQTFSSRYGVNIEKHGDEVVHDYS